MTTQVTEADLVQLYKRDFNLWLEHTAARLRSRQLDQLDLDNLVEEIEGLSKSDKRAIASNLRVLLTHLLKWKYQPDRRSGSWRGTIDEHRDRIQQILDDSPSLRNYYLEVFEQRYAKARKQAEAETSMSLEAFPEQSPFTPEQVMDEDYLPEF